ncbi:hypothetical protein TanjilG_21378 [Lupinus angustifolius]|uniref:Uncharacterized protein n=1 Tax=Lupinus angustifolius TaxID=3871 RepID=A0A4P1RN11_LUPAN|nr:PREDICTED: uncharacterized protein LOC109344785 [Lupinus angustifolius]OIW14238.1 hypothetical protein TanjilG_21378 [Lupinus angustifolius]
MRTKIEYSINLLATSIDSNKFTASGVDVCKHYQNKGLNNSHYSIGVNKLQDPMDRRVLEKNHIESIQKTMQMHEDIFKYQVRELHRVHSVQKMLMDEHKKEKGKNFWTSMNSISLCHPHFIQQQQTTQISSYGPDLHVQRLKDIYSKERSGNYSGETIKRRRSFDLERPAEVGYIFAATKHGCNEDEAGPSSFTAFQNCQISTNGSDEDMEMDLTLSIGGSHVKKKKKSLFLPLRCLDSPNGKTKELNSSVTFQSDRGRDCSDPTTPMSKFSVTFDQERKGAIGFLKV